MPLYLSELLLLFCFARGVTFKELRDMACWNSGKMTEQTLARQKISQRLRRCGRLSPVYALAIAKPTIADKRVLKKLTESLLSMPRRCRDAPR
jgi:hypothetical protein